MVSATQPIGTMQLEVEESGDLLPHTWEGVDLLPPLPRPELTILLCERALGVFTVTVLSFVYWGISEFLLFMVRFVVRMSMDGVTPEWYDWPFAYGLRWIIKLIIVLAYIIMVVLWATNSRYAKRRSPAACFPLPAVLLDRARVLIRAAPPGPTEALRSAASESKNLTDDDGRVYCVRCFMWRTPRGHHCSTCQFCVEDDFDHHCTVLGCCIHGRGWRGNYWAFVLIIACAALDLAAALHPLTAIVALKVTGSQRVAKLAMFATPPILIVAAWRGMNWFFYERHAHLRASVHAKLRSQ